MKKKKIYAIYKGDKFLFMGTKKECAEYFGVKEETIKHWKSVKNYGENQKIAIIVEDIDEF